MGLRGDAPSSQQRRRRIRQTAATTRSPHREAEDVAEVAAFLAANAAEYITGQSINVTGGGVMH